MLEEKEPTQSFWAWMMNDVRSPFKIMFLSLVGMRNIFDCVYPCPCGYYGDAQKQCTCAPALVTKYQKRISGPLLDRIDIHIEVPRVVYEKLSADQGFLKIQTLRGCSQIHVQP